jgi:hypothetical protein
MSFEDTVNALEIAIKKGWGTYDIVDGTYTLYNMEKDLKLARRWLNGQKKENDHTEKFKDS